MSLLDPRSHVPYFPRMKSGGCADHNRKVKHLGRDEDRRARIEGKRDKQSLLARLLARCRKQATGERGCSRRAVASVRAIGVVLGPNRIRPRVWSRSRFRHAFQPLPRYLTRENSTGLKHAGKESLQNSQVRPPDAAARRSRMRPHLLTDSLGGQNNRACRSRTPRAIVGTPGGRRWTLGPRCDRSDTVSPPSARPPRPSFAKPPRPGRRSRSSSTASVTRFAHATTALGPRRRTSTGSSATFSSMASAIPARGAPRKSRPF